LLQALWLVVRMSLGGQVGHALVPAALPAPGPGGAPPGLPGPAEPVPWAGAVVFHDPREWPLEYRRRVRVPVWMQRGWWRGQMERGRVRWHGWKVRWALRGVRSMAAIVELLTRQQLRQQLGALPVLYGLLEGLGLRRIVRRVCPTASPVDHGTVVLVLVLNRLMQPGPLYHVAQWMARTVLGEVLGVPAEKFNDDRLRRTLDAIEPHLEELWMAVRDAALRRFKIDLAVVFQDMTAYVLSGGYADSQLVEYGFAHNTRMDQKKVKVELNVSGDGNILIDYWVWSGSTVDQATVEQNMEQLKKVVERHGGGEIRVVGDRARLNDVLAWVYDRLKIWYVCGLEAQRKEHRRLLTEVSEESLERHPLTAERGRHGYYGVRCRVPFTHEGKTMKHWGVVVLSGPMRSAVRQGRAQQMRELRQALREVEQKIGQVRYRSVKEVQARVNTCCRRSPVGKLVWAWAEEHEGVMRVRWQLNRAAWAQALKKDGRYLLVTNDARLTPEQMLALYRSKDGVEKQIGVSKHDLQVSPLYVHTDARIKALVWVNMVALLAYSLLEREVRGHGLALTTRRLIAELETLDVVVTECWDGSVLRRLTPVSPAQAELLRVLGEILEELWWEVGLPELVAAQNALPGREVRCLPGPREGSESGASP